MASSRLLPPRPSHMACLPLWIWQAAVTSPWCHTLLRTQSTEWVPYPGQVTSSNLNSCIKSGQTTTRTYLQVAFSSSNGLVQAREQYDKTHSPFTNGRILHCTIQWANSALLNFSHSRCHGKAGVGDWGNHSCIGIKLNLILQGTAISEKCSERGIFLATRQSHTYRILLSLSHLVGRVSNLVAVQTSIWEL